jgi:hypothetical protein
MLNHMLWCYRIRFAKYKLHDLNFNFQLFLCTLDSRVFSALHRIFFGRFWSCQKINNRFHKTLTDNDYYMGSLRSDNPNPWWILHGLGITVDASHLFVFVCDKTDEFANKSNMHSHQLRHRPHKLCTHYILYLLWQSRPPFVSSLFFGDLDRNWLHQNYIWVWDLWVTTYSYLTVLCCQNQDSHCWYHEFTHWFVMASPNDICQIWYKNCAKVL